MKHRIEFTLRQHTPLIHFQHDQPGATLRATELKPKLDRFLIERFPDLPHRTHPNGKRSLDYRVTIETKNVDFDDIPDRHPLFFGNMGGGNKKRFSQADSVTIIFRSFRSETLKAIEASFTAFLAVTNFGTRQSKGFGSFYREDHPFNPSLVDSDRYTKVYSFSSDRKNYQRHIDLLYRFLRTGINDFNFHKKQSFFYTKPAVFHYAQKQNWIWDKRAIKERLLQVAEVTDPQRYRLVRDLFGLSTEQMWRSYDKTKILKSHREIERYKSPIFFKPIQEGAKMKVYFFAEKDNHPMLNQRFTIRSTRPRRQMNLVTPQNFDWEDFFDFAFSLDLSKIVEKKYKNSQSYRDLNNILTEIRSDR